MADINKLPDNSHENEPEKKVSKKKKNPGLFARIRKWFRELRSELNKVTWPTRSQVIKNTGVALVVMVISAIILWGFDSIAGQAVRTLITLVG